MGWQFSCRWWPYFSVSVRLNGLILIGLFFARNIRGSVLQAEIFTRTDYWVHTGGYLTGMVIGYILRLHKDASKESVTDKALKLSQKPFREKDAADQYEEILKHSQNRIALNYMLERYHGYNPEKASPHFRSLMAVLIDDDFPSAVALFNTYFPAYVQDLGERELLRLGLHFYRNAALLKARRCLELVSQCDGPLKPKALFSLALT